MRSISRVVCTFASLMAMLAGSGAPLAEAGVNVWTSNGPAGERIQALAIDPTSPSTLYAGSSRGGVFKSTDGGGSWSAVNSGLTHPNLGGRLPVVNALAINPLTPSTVYAGTS